MRLGCILGHICVRNPSSPCKILAFFVFPIPRPSPHLCIEAFTKFSWFVSLVSWLACSFSENRLFFLKMRLNQRFARWSVMDWILAHVGMCHGSNPEIPETKIVGFLPSLYAVSAAHWPVRFSGRIVSIPPNKRPSRPSSFCAGPCLALSLAFRGIRSGF